MLRSMHDTSSNLQNQVRFFFGGGQLFQPLHNNIPWRGERRNTSSWPECGVLSALLANVLFFWEGGTHLPLCNFFLGGVS